MTPEHLRHSWVWSVVLAKHVICACDGRTAFVVDNQHTAKQIVSDHNTALATRKSKQRQDEIMIGSDLGGW